MRCGFPEVKICINPPSFIQQLRGASPECGKCPIANEIITRITKGEADRRKLDPTRVDIIYSNAYTVIGRLPEGTLVVRMACGILMDKSTPPTNPKS